jgi:hypothetical protein
MSSHLPALPLHLDPLIAEAKRRATRRRLILVAAFLAAVVAGTALALRPTGGSGIVRTSPPPGLTSYGRAVWNLDALLHDYFGARQVWLSARGSYPKAPDNFSTHFVAMAGSRFVVYTFANSHGSAFTLVRPKYPPRALIGASGWETPLTLRGSYISCGHAKWLYEHGGEGPANWLVACVRRH